MVSVVSVSMLAPVQLQLALFTKWFLSGSRSGSLSGFLPLLLIINNGMYNTVRCFVVLFHVM